MGKRGVSGTGTGSVLIVFLIIGVLAMVFLGVPVVVDAAEKSQFFIIEDIEDKPDEIDVTDTTNVEFSDTNPLADPPADYSLDLSRNYIFVKNFVIFSFCSLKTGDKCLNMR